jgi:hypothetical protein
LLQHLKNPDAEGDLRIHLSSAFVDPFAAWDG